MHARRLPAVALTASSLLTLAWALGAGGCGPGPVQYACAQGTLGEIGADGGPDPCHCNPPYGGGCACTDPNEFNQSGFTGTQLFQFCLQSLDDAGDAGQGGPLPGCTGQCWTEPPLGWSSPLLLWVGEESTAPPCPGVAPVVLYEGQANGAFALACTSTASGSCPGLADVCGPAQVDGFWPCVSIEGDHACVSLSPYTEPHVFYADTFGATTFCCLPSPPTPQ